MKMNAGFIPALGTPVDENGIFLPESYEKQIDDMLEAGAVAVLVLGSMGMMYAIRQDQYRSVVETAIEAVGGRCPVLVGAMDNSLWRVKERLRYLAGLDIDGIVLTPPYYYASTPDELVRFYVGVAQVSPYNVYMYDLPVVTQTKITYSSIERVLAETDKLKGIKTADQALGRNLILSKNIPSDFSVIYSGLIRWTSLTGGELPPIWTECLHARLACLVFWIKAYVRAITKRRRSIWIKS